MDCTFTMYTNIDGVVSGTNSITLPCINPLDAGNNLSNGDNGGPMIADAHRYDYCTSDLGNYCDPVIYPTRQPILGASLSMGDDDFFRNNYGQYVMKLERVDYDYCNVNGSGSIIENVAAYIPDDGAICSMPFSVTN